jgi:hypothetical protein
VKKSGQDCRKLLPLLDDVVDEVAGEAELRLIEEAIAGQITML